MSDDERDARILDRPTKLTHEVIEENRFFGYMFLLGPNDEFGIYYETLEGLGFVCGLSDSLHRIGLESGALQEMAAYFDAELAALEGLGEDAKSYVQKMRSLPLRFWI